MRALPLENGFLLVACSILSTLLRSPGGRPGMQDRGGVRVRRRMDKTKGVPTDQQPFNELQELKEDVLFGWAQEDFKVWVPDARTAVLQGSAR